MTRTLLVTDMNLIGDFVMTLPATVEFIKRVRERGDVVDYWPHKDAEPVWSMLPPELHLVPLREPVDRSAYDRVVAFDLHGTARRSSDAGCYGTQGFFVDVGSPIPGEAPRPQLTFASAVSLPIFDFGLAPFSRSLPAHERWPRERWQALVDAMPDATFALFGAGGLDDPAFVVGPNVRPVIGHPLAEVTDAIARLRRGLISVSTGLAHLAFAVGTRLVLISNQGTFSTPPTAVRVAGGMQPDQVSLDALRAAL